MGIVLYQLQWIVPVRVTGMLAATILDRPMVIRYSMWLFRLKKFGRKKEVMYLDG